MPITLLCWNIANPSEQRAVQQAMWLRQQAADVYVLTECKRSRGCDFLERFFPAYGYNVHFQKPIGNEYGVLIACKFDLTISNFTRHIDYLESRVAAVAILSILDRLEIIGVYVPSRGFDTGERATKKKRFIENLYHALESSDSDRRIFCGDLNVLEPDHIPHYPHFYEWEYDFYRKLSNYRLTDTFRFFHPEVQEYSWVGRSQDGYRYDHCFVSNDLLPAIENCSYIHHTRTTKLSDHSAMVLEVNC